ncbi:MAG TPA: M48 family metalloprotease [Gemmatimonadales bacterium]|nr:M48 family metalloprotease [Gemmatimonadales bacterium]
MFSSIGLRQLPPRARLALLSLVAACAVNPATGQHQLMLVSEDQEIAMGKESDPAIIQQMGLYPDSAWQRYISDIGHRLAAKGERPQLPWTFRVIDDPVINAFALPGGFIYITRGILAEFNSEAELSGVLGHEIGHVTARHSAQQMTKQQVAQLGLGVASVASKDVAKYADVATQGLGLLFLKFSRDDESQADELGLRYMRRVGYDPRQMPIIFAMLGRVTAASGSRIPEWQATHPDPEHRYQRMEQLLAAIPKDSMGTIVNEESYLRRLEGLVYGDNPRDGYFKGQRFLQPDLGLELTFPPGWQTANTRSAVQGVSAKQDAGLLLTLANEKTPDAAATAFYAQQGIQGGPARASRINGLDASGGDFSAQTQQGAVTGSVTFIAHDGVVVQLLAYGPQAGWSANAAAVNQTMQSFRRITDTAVLNVQPWRISLIKLDRDMSVEEFAQRYPTPVPVAKVALLNDVDPGARFQKGALVKRVVGTPLP